MSRREQTKADRRALLMDVAQEFVRTAGIGSVTIRSVAAHAGLSPTTVYNLFGSKGQLIIAILGRDLAAADELLRSSETTDLLENFFLYARLSVDRYAADPGFYRAVLFPNVNSRDPAPILWAMRDPRFENLKRYVDAAVAGGVLRSDADPKIVTTLLSQCMGGALVEWAAGVKQIAQTRAEIQLASAVALLGFAAEEVATRIHRKISHLQADIQKSALPDEKL